MAVSIGRIAREIPIANLATPTHKLVRASSLEEASRLFVEYDVVPSPAHGRITAFYDKYTGRRHEIGPAGLLSSNTPILDLPGLLTKRPFFFVNRANAIVGYIHYSDLNKPPARAPFYMLLEAAETSVASTLSAHLTDVEIRAVTTPGQFKRLQYLLARRRKNNLDLGWVAVLGLAEMLRIARRTSGLRLDDADLAMITKYRNRVAHPNSRLVESYPDVRELSRATALLERIAGSA